MANDRSLRDHLLALLDSGNAHLTFADAVKDFPPELRGTRPAGGPHSAWELLEHLRITQWDILEFTRDSAHVSPPWPAGYWPQDVSPPSNDAWDESVKAFRTDRAALAKIIADESLDLFSRIEHGDGQTVLREILLTADHNAYHLGQFVMVRKLLAG